MRSKALVREMGLGRDFNPRRYPSHRRASSISAIAWAVMTLGQTLGGEELIPALLAGLNAALACFVTWIIAREWDPDRNATAHAAQILTAVYVIAFAQVPILPTATLIFFSRFLSRITGLELRNWQVLPAAFFVFTFAVFSKDPALAIGLGLLFVIDSRLNEAYEQSHWLGPTLLIGGFVYTFFFWPGTASGNIGLGQAAIGVVIVLNIWELAGMKRLQSRCDFGDKDIDPGRFRWAVLLGLLVAAAPALLGFSDPTTYLPALAAFTARLIPQSLLKPEGT